MSNLPKYLVQKSRHNHVKGIRTKNWERGNFLVEFALIAPVLVLICLAAMDAGVYMFSFISVQNAARAAAIRNAGGRDSASDQQTACAIATDNLRGLPGVASPNSCARAPLQVSSQLCDQNASCGSAASSADTEAATLVIVSYTPPSLFRIPLAGPLTVRGTSQMKLRNNE